MTSYQRTRALLITSFGSVVLLLVIGHVITYQRQRYVENSVSVIEDNALASIRLMSRMDSDRQRERILVDRHVFEHDRVLMAGIENQIASVKTDFDAAARAYEPLVRFEGEQAQWRQLQADLAAGDLQLARALELSRDNHDTDAMKVLADAEPLQEAIARDLQATIAINEAGADRAQHAIAQLLDEVLVWRLFIGAAIVLVTALVGFRATRTISRDERQLADQAAALEAKNRELDAFAGRVSHDLRGPLNTISLAASMLAERVPDEEKTTSLMRRGIAQMTNLVQDLLDLSRLGASTKAMSGGVQHVVSALEKDLATLVGTAGGTLRIDLEPATVTCSEGLLRQVLWNLGENAIKYKRPNTPPELEIIGRAEAGGYMLRVTDNGLGMSADEVSHAFDPFFRGAQVGRIPGTGLGLAIVRRVIETSGGSIKIESEPKRGTTFVIELPLAAPVQGVGATRLDSAAS